MGGLIASLKGNNLEVTKVARITAVSKLQAELNEIGDTWEKLEIRVCEGKYKYLVCKKLTGEEVMRDTTIENLRVKLNWYFRGN